MTTQAYETQTELGHLSAGISAGATSITLVSGEGANFDTDLPYDIMIGGDAGETVSLTSIATDTLTISATAGAWAEGTAVFMIAALSQPRTSGQLALISDITGGGGSGDVVGPASATDNAIARYDGTSGTLIKNSTPIVQNDGRISTVTDPTGAQDAATKAYVDAQTGIAGGSDTEVQWNNAGLLDGSPGLTIDGGYAAPAAPTETTAEVIPTTPSAPAIIYSRTRGRSLLASVDYLGLETVYEPHRKHRPKSWDAYGPGTASTDVFGPWTTAGTATAAAWSAAAYGQICRVFYRSSTGGNAVAGVRSNYATWFRSGTAGLGGLHFIARFGLELTRADMRAFVGVYYLNSTPLAGDPSAFINCAGFMVDRGQTNFRWGVNDGADTCTVTDLGASFPTNTSAVDFYEAQIVIPPGNAGIVHYSLANIITGALARGSSSSNLPTVDTALNAYCMACKDGASPGTGAIDLAVQHVSITELSVL